MNDLAQVMLLFVTIHMIIRAGCNFAASVQFAFKAVIVLFDPKVLAF